MLPQIVVSSLSVLSYAAILLYESPLLFISFLALAALQAIPAWFLCNRFEDAYLHMSEVEEEMTQWILQAHSGWTTLKLFRAIPWYFHKKAILDRTYIQKGFHADALVSLEEAVGSLIETLIRIASYALIAVWILRNILVPEQGVKILVLAGSFFAAVQALFAFVPRHSRKQASAQRLRALFQDALHLTEEERLQIGMGEIVSWTSHSDDRAANEVEAV